MRCEFCKSENLTEAKFCGRCGKILINEDFPSGVGAAKFAVIAGIVNDVESKSALQAGGFAEAAQQFEVKDTCCENLRDEMSDISRTAKSMEYEFARFADKFRFQRNMNDATMLATARAFITEAGPYAADFKDDRLRLRRRPTI